MLRLRTNRKIHVNEFVVASSALCTVVYLQGPWESGKGGYMKYGIGLGIGVALFATLSVAEGVAPQDVVYGEYGAIDQSLSGTPGDVERGAVLMNKGSGNCIACHAVSALSHLDFHGEVGP